MEGFAAFDGGRSLKAGLLAFGTLLFAAPALAQGADPLAPLPSPSTVTLPTPAPPPVTIFQLPSQSLQPIQATPAPQAAPPVLVAPAPAPVTIAVPKDWRGVFDAIDAGNWVSAQAGI